MQHLLQQLVLFNLGIIIVVVALLSIIALIVASFRPVPLILPAIVKKVLSRLG